VVLRLVDSPSILFGICAALFVIAAVQAVLIGSTKSAQRREIGGGIPGRWWLTGWRQMRSDPAVMHAAVELTLLSMSLIILSGLIPKFIEDTLGLPVDIGALVLTPAAIGVVLGLRVAGFLAHRVPHSLLSTFGFAAYVVCLGLLCFVNQESDFLSGYGMFSWLGSIEIGSFEGGGVLAMFLVLPLGFAYAVVSVAGQTVINDRVPLHLQGRVGSTQAAMSALASSVPVVLAGLLSDVFGVTPVMALVAGAIGVAAVANIREPRRLSPAPASVT
jgi:MFS family permease